MKTNLEAVKLIAKYFLRLDPVPDPMFPDMIIHHPFYNSTALFYVNKDNTPIIFPYTDKEKYNNWLNYMVGNIEKADKITTLLMMLCDSYYMEFIKYIHKYLSKEDLVSVLTYCWTKQEYPNYNSRGSLLIIKKLIKQTKPLLLDQDELSKLPDVVTIYRGQVDKPYYKALSWTTSIYTAKWFATRFNKKGRLFKADIKKEDILAMFNERGESELVVDYSKLMNLQEIVNFC